MTLPLQRPAERGSRDTAALIADILRTVAADFGLTVQSMMAPTRETTVFRARMAAMFLTRALTDQSLPQLGRVFEGRSHTSRCWP